MEPEPVPEAVDARADDQLRTGVLGPDATHEFTAVALAQGIGHALYFQPVRSPSATMLAISRASRGGTALPTCRYCSVRGPSKK